MFARERPRTQSVQQYDEGHTSHITINIATHHTVLDITSDAASSASATFADNAATSFAAGGRSLNAGATPGAA